MSTMVVMPSNVSEIIYSLDLHFQGQTLTIPFRIGSGKQIRVVRVLFQESLLFYGSRLNKAILARNQMKFALSV